MTCVQEVYRKEDKSIMKTIQELELLAAGVARLLAKGEKISAIKLVRENTDYGLKESKDFVDHVDRCRGRGKKCGMYAQVIGATHAELTVTNAIALPRTTGSVSAGKHGAN